jgi:hypothetical protein
MDAVVNKACHKVLADFNGRLVEPLHFFSQNVDTNRSLQFQERGELSSTHNETVPVAVSINDPDCAPFIVENRDPAHTKSGFLKIVGDYFTGLLRDASCLFCTPHEQRQFSRVTSPFPA